MSRIMKNSMLSTGVLVALGLVAIYAGPGSLVMLIPAALLVWYGSHPPLKNGRN